MLVEKISPLGEKLTELACKVSIPPQREVDATSEIWTEGLLLRPKSGQSLLLPYTEILEIEPVNYRIRVVTPSNVITLSALGLKFDPISQRLVDAWRDALSRALLMHEPSPIYETNAAYTRTLENGPSSSGVCKVRIYPTSLLVLPSDTLPIRLSLSSISSVVTENYRVKVVSPRHGAFEFYKMGNLYQFLADKVIEAQRNLEKETLETLKEMLPLANYEQLQALARICSEGRAARKSEVDSVSSDLWNTLETRVKESPLAETYAYITSIGIRDHSAIGLKKTPENVYVWFLVPVRGSVEDGGGNTLVMEVTSKTGHATYLFRVMGRKDFPSASAESFSAEAENTIEAVNEAMVATGFRREPIYLSDESLSTPAYSKYLYAAKNLDALRFLRERFYGRIIHTTYENWQKDLTDALLFNTKTLDDDQARWSKSELEEDEELQPQELQQPQLQSVTATPVTTGQAAVQVQVQKSLNATEEPSPNTMIERLFTVESIQQRDEGFLAMRLRDKTKDDYTVDIVLPQDDIGKLMAFPGSTVKVAMEKA